MPYSNGAAFTTTGKCDGFYHNQRLLDFIRRKYRRNWLRCVHAALVVGERCRGERVQRIGRAIQKGAQAFLRREYPYVAILLVIVVPLILLSLIPNSGMSLWTALAFVSGAVASALAIVSLVIAPLLASGV